jgi:predicted GIY-YIG superfamily endonuclease
MFYTYILQSQKDPGRRYVGHTADLRARLAEHNEGKCPHTSKFLPWKLKVYIAFESIKQAQRFEKYLKSGSGRAFASRHFWSTEDSPEE